MSLTREDVIRAVQAGRSLAGADLRGLDLSSAPLRSADFSGANLEGANLEGANLQCADLRGANLMGTKMRGTKLQFSYRDPTVRQRPPAVSRGGESIHDAAQRIRAEVARSFGVGVDDLSDVTNGFKGERSKILVSARHMIYQHLSDMGFAVSQIAEEMCANGRTVERALEDSRRARASEVLSQKQTGPAQLIARMRSDLAALTKLIESEGASA